MTDTMSISYHSKLTTVRPQGKRTTNVARATAVQQCLIVSTNAARRSMFVQAATDAGWETLTCVDAESGLACLGRNLVQLAIIDIDGEQAEDFQQMLNRLRLSSGVLTLVCGNDGDAEEEVLVRQMGAWLYLPGVETGSDLTSVCDQARQVCERRNSAVRSTRPATLPLRRSG
jgi:DNA-binding NtrC family response regulator